MANKKISELLADSSIDGTEIIPASQGGSTKRVTIQQIADFSATGGGSTTYAGLTDAGTVDLPTVNTPLGVALALKAPLVSPTFSGTVSGITKAMVGLGSADDTADADKPVSTAQATALALKQDTLVSGTHVKTINGSSIVGSGNLVIAGGGVDEFTDLSDAATVDLPVLNGPLTTALGQKQATLISGTNIKTINGTTLLGSGDIVISGGGTYSDVLARVFDARDYGLVVNDPSEEAANTARFDLMLADWKAARGGTIYLPQCGIYYGSCVIPNVNADSPGGGGFTPFPIRFLGGTPPYLAQGTVVGGLTRLNNEWTIIRSTTSTPAITTGTLGNYTIVTLENIECQSTGSALHCVKINGNQAYIRGNVLITNGTWGNMNTWPINNTGLYMPGDGNGGLNTIDNLAIVGFKTGLMPGEHLVCGHYQGYYCEQAILNIANHHVNTIHRYQGGHNKFDLVTAGGSSATHALISINQFDCEGSGNTVANIKDETGILRGSINWWNVKPTFGWYNNFVIVGTNPETFKATQVGDNPKDFIERGTLLPGATRYVPTTDLDAWGETAERDAWYSYGLAADLGTDAATPVTLAAGTDGWIAQQYKAKSRGAFVGLLPSTGPAIGFTIDHTGSLISYPGSGSTVDTTIAAVDGTFYRLNRVAGTYTIESYDTVGTVWTVEYTIPSAFGGSPPAGDYTAHMVQGLIGANTHFEGGIYYPQGDFTGGMDLTAPNLVSATVQDSTPDRVDLVFDEPMNATWSAPAAWAVSAHTVSAVTRLTDTTGYLTVTPDFVASETATLDYTQPGTNKMQDLAGSPNLLANISGFTITDLVGLGLPAGLFDHWSAGSGTSLVGGEVDTWTGDNGTVLLAPTAGQRPAFSATGGWDNNPYLTFSGAEFLHVPTATPGLTDDYTTILVMKNTTASTVGSALSYNAFNHSGGFTIFLNTDGINNVIEPFHTGDVGTNTRKTVTPGTTSWFFAECRNHKSNVVASDPETFALVNGTSTLAGTPATADNTNGFVASSTLGVGGLIDGSLPAHMELSEVYIWPRILSPAEVTTVKSLLQGGGYPSIP